MLIQQVAARTRKATMLRRGKGLQKMLRLALSGKKNPSQAQWREKYRCYNSTFVRSGCLITEKPEGNKQPLIVTPLCFCVSFSSRARCWVSSPQSRSLFPYSLSAPALSNLLWSAEQHSPRAVCVCLRSNGFFSLRCTCHYSCLVCLSVLRNCLLVSLF